MLRTKIKYENKQRAITQKLSKRVLWFLCIALHLDEIYPPSKFHNHSLVNLRDMHWKTFKYKKKRAITQKLSKQELWLYTLYSHLMRSIHPQNFITLASILLEICSGQNSSKKLNPFPTTKF